MTSAETAEYGRRYAALGKEAGRRKRRPRIGPERPVGQMSAYHGAPFGLPHAQALADQVGATLTYRMVPRREDHSVPDYAIPRMAEYRLEIQPAALWDALSALGWSLAATGPTTAVFTHPGGLRYRGRDCDSYVLMY